MKNPSLIRRVAQAIRRRYLSVHFQLMDWTIIGYLLLIGVLIVPFHHDVACWGVYPILHLLLAAGILEYVRFSESRQSRFWRIVRIFYPFLFATMGWKELDNLITMIFPYWANKWVIRTDLFLFGVHPTVWVEGLFTPWLTEFMNLLYSSFWFYTPVVGILLYVKKPEQDVFDFFFMVSFAYAVCFLLFLIFPSEGAWVILKDLHHAEPQGGFFRELNRTAQEHGTIRGGAFPSSHVTIAFVVACAAVKYLKKLGIAMLVLAFGIAVSTVYCRYHHAIDAISGMAAGFVLFCITNRIVSKKRG